MEKWVCVEGKEETTRFQSWLMLVSALRIPDGEYSREMAGNTNLKQDNQIKWAFKNSLFSQTFQNRPSFIWVVFWVQIVSSPILQIKKYWKLAGKVYYLGIYLKREFQFQLYMCIHSQCLGGKHAGL